MTTGNNPAANTLVTATVTCPSGVALGGGALVTVSSSGQDGRVALRSSYPSSTTQWTAVAVVDAAVTGSRTVSVTPYVLCSP